MHGIRLSRLIAGEGDHPSFESDYARTKRLVDIHEFGYFWRFWLKKDTFDDVVRSRELEDEIDWPGLKRTLINIQHEFERPFIAKNMLGAYHMPRLRELLEKVVYVHVERDPLDVSVSILDARRKYYSDPNTWWSYVPLEYPRLSDRDYWEQIAGQVHYLARFYGQALAAAGKANVVTVTYEQVTRDPAAVLEAVAQRVASACDYELRIRQSPPPAFPFREHGQRNADKQCFQEILARLRAEDP